MNTLFFQSILQFTGITIIDEIGVNTYTIPYYTLYVDPVLTEKTAYATVYYQVPGIRISPIVMSTLYGDQKRRYNRN